MVSAHPDDQVLRIWDARTWKLIAEVPQSEPVEVMALNSGGTKLAVSYPAPSTVVKVFDVAKLIEKYAVKGE